MARRDDVFGLISLPIPGVQRAQQPPDGWQNKGNTLVRELLFRSFEDGMQFLDRVAAEAVDYNRHPAMSIYNGNVRLSIHNPNDAGITEAEIRLAQKVDAVIRSDERLLHQR